MFHGCPVLQQKWKQQEYNTVQIFFISKGLINFIAYKTRAGITVNEELERRGKEEAMASSNSPGWTDTGNSVRTASLRARIRIWDHMNTKQRCECLRAGVVFEVI
jgi:hypothetical protein